MVAALVSLPAEASAFDGLWHAGIDAGYALGAFPDAAVNGFGGGLHLAYGISDAFNLRLNADVSAFDLPEPATSALIYAGALGAEYSLDVLDWVLYVGALAGPANVAIQDGADLWQMTVQVPLGLSWMFSPNWAVGIEGQYRLFFLGPEGSPGSGLVGFGRFEYIFGR
jgi:opacity protein-like surface antigen